jgi:hypothetical protein
MDTFRGRASRHLTALRQFPAGVPIQDSSVAIGMTNSNGHDFAERVRHNQRQLTSDPDGWHIIVTAGLKK